MKSVAIALAFVSLVAASFAGCCDPKGQFELIATVVDGPTGQIIPTPAFTGDASYAKCRTYYGGGGIGGGAQNLGPCLEWIVFANENGKAIGIEADGYEGQSFDVPKGDPNACGAADSEKQTFRLKRRGN